VRILVLLTDGFGGHGGIAKFNRDLLRALTRHPRCEQVTALPRIGPAKIESLPPKLDYVTAGLGNKFKYVATVLKHGRKARPDAVVCAHINLLPVAWLAAVRARVPLILIIHGVEAWQAARSPLVNWCARKAAGVVAVSRVTLERFRNWSGIAAERGHVLPNCVEMERFAPGGKDPELMERYNLQGRKVLMTLGRLDERERYKGIDEVIDVLPEIARLVPNVTYLIAGDGSDRSRLRQKADDAGLNGRVVFTGHVSESEKADHFRLADAFVMPGRGEGFGIVYLEAMACGVPVVASAADASREAVREGKLGWVVDPDDREQIKAGIVAALDRGAGKVPEGLEYFSYPNFERRCHDIIDRVVEAN
jgi:phosphatidyl-myo-inositol dimannoside synthase